MTNNVPTLPAPAPAVEPESRPYWEAAADGRLVLPHCTDCDQFVWYPRAHCPTCHGTNLVWEQVSGSGSVYSFSVLPKARDDYASVSNLALAYVELDEGPRVITNIVECPASEIHIGMRVEAVFHSTGEGTALVRFQPAAAGTP